MRNLFTIKLVSISCETATTKVFFIAALITDEGEA